MLRSSEGALNTAYDLAMLDLDGVVYVGDHAVAGAADGIARAREAGMHVAFITNNAARAPETVAHHLGELGVDAAPGDVVTSAQAAAHLLREHHGAGARVYLAGGPGLERALLAEGLEPVTTADGPLAAVVTGYGPELPWGRIVRAAVLIGDGVPWVATNTDLTIPTSYGLGPGHGVLVRMLSEFTGVTPTVAGKPERALLDETVRRVGGERPLMVGDRLDTDIEGAHHAGMDSLLVLTGVTGLRELLTAEPRMRPTYIAPDLAGLNEAHTAPLQRGGVHDLHGWLADVDRHGSLDVAGSGTAADWWRVAAAAAWHHREHRGFPPDFSRLVPPTGPGLHRR